MRNDTVATVVGPQRIRPVAVSALWLAWYAQWLTIPPIIVPDQVSTLLGGDKTRAELATGSVVAIGAVVAMFVAPVAGALSDRAAGARGRRRPFLIVGVLASCVSLGVLGLASQGVSLLLYALAYINLQVWWNWAAGPAAGLIPDVIPAPKQSTASGWLNVLGTIGVIGGNGLVLLLYAPNRPWPAMLGFVVLNLACLAVTLRAREQPASRQARPRGMPAFLRSFWISPGAHPNFYIVLATRFLSNMGMWSVLTFLLFYMETVLGLDAGDAAQLLPKLFLLGAVLSIPASIVGVRLADRNGLVRTVQVISWVMAAATVCFVLIAFNPAEIVLIPVMLVFTVANGAYGAVDWLLALRVLPSGQDSGKDFGVWHICMVLPQMIGPLSTGLLITLLKTAASPRVAYEAAFAIGAAWFVLSAALVGRVRLLERVGDHLGEINSGA